MIYIISGTSRSGKTLIAEKIMQQRQIPYLSLDWLVMGFTHGIPEYGIHDKLWPNEIAERIWPFLKAMLKNMIWSQSKDYIIEGEAVLPELFVNFIKEHPNSVKICFIGFADIDLEEKVKNIYKYSKGKNDWLTNEPEAYVEDHIGNMIAYSKRIKKDCKKHNLKYFDTSTNFNQVLDDAIKYLLEG